MKTFFSSFASFSSLVLVFGFQPLASAADFNDLQAHRAVYEVSLESAEDRSGIVGAKGRIVFMLEGNACEGISTNYRFVTQLRTPRDSFVTDQQTASHESGDGRELSFNTKSFVNEQQDQNLSGSATRESGGLTVILNGKNARKLKLEDAVFSSTQMVQVLEAAQADERFLAVDIFDGIGDADEVIKTSTIIGKAKEIDGALEGENPDALTNFEGRKAWPITISYFKKNIGNSAETFPFYEASYLLYDDGVVRDLLMRFEDYALKANLSDIELIDTKSCT